MFSFLKGENMNCAYPSIQETLPASTLGYQSNNRFKTFPPMMNDGRSIVSSWEPESYINNGLIKMNNIQSNWQYRHFIQKNADYIVKHNLTEACNDTGYFMREVNPPPTGPPKLYHSLYEISPMENESDLKELYLSRERLESRKVAPEMTQAELMEKYGITLKK